MNGDVRPMKTEMREGDILLSKSREGFRLSKVLRITPCPDGSADRPRVALPSSRGEAYA